MANPDVIEVTLSLDTSAYADGDVLADTQEVPHVFRGKNDSRKLTSVALLDEDDQGVALDLVFASANVSLGTENLAPDITDANARSLLGALRIATTDYIDLGGSRLATVRGINLMLESAADSTSLYMGAITRGGTPTHTAAGIKVRLGFE
jgi:hypothetical protein